MKEEEEEGGGGPGGCYPNTQPPVRASRASSALLWGGHLRVMDDLKSLSIRQDRLKASGSANTHHFLLPLSPGEVKINSANSVNHTPQQAEHTGWFYPPTQHTHSLKKNKNKQNKQKQGWVSRENEKWPVGGQHSSRDVTGHGASPERTELIISLVMVPLFDSQPDNRATGRHDGCKCK